jgi:hypothetical protein
MQSPLERRLTERRSGFSEVIARRLAAAWALVAKRVGTIGRSERCSNILTKFHNIESVAPRTERPLRGALRRAWCEAPFFAYVFWRSKESKCRLAQGSMKIKNIIPSQTRGSYRSRKAKSAS